MIVYGADEAFKWQTRVAQFTGAVRCALKPQQHMVYVLKKGYMVQALKT